MRKDSSYGTAICPVCKKKFQKYHKRHIYCSKRCMRRYHRKGSREERILESRKYRRENKDKVREYNRKWRREHADKIKEYRKRYNDNNKGKRKVRNIDGKEAKKECCSKCGSTKNLELHHLTYNIGHYVVLCKSCHHKEHSKPVDEV